MFLQSRIKQVKAASSCVCGVGEQHSGEASSGPSGSPHQKGSIRRLPGDMPSPPLRQHVGCHPGASGEDVTGQPRPWLQTREWWLTMFFEEKPLADAFHSEHCNHRLHVCLDPFPLTLSNRTGCAAPVWTAGWGGCSSWCWREGW